MDEKQFVLKRTDKVEVLYIEAESPKIVKRYLRADELVRNRLNDEVIFLEQYSHPYFVDLLDYDLDAPVPSLEFAYFPGMPLFQYLRQHPWDEKLIWLLLVHFVRYLSYNKIYIGDLKPDHILVLATDGLPQIKIIDLTPNPDIVTVVWTAPEQYQGRISWKSNLFTIAMMFASRYSSPEEVKQRILNDKPLILPETCPIASSYKDFFHALPEMRMNDLEAYLLANPVEGVPILNCEPDYNSFTEFHQGLCDSLYTLHIPYLVSYALYQKYCLPHPLVCPSNMEECFNAEFQPYPLQELIRKENLTWDCASVYKDKLSKDVKGDWVSLTQAITRLRPVVEAWDFASYRDLFPVLLQHLEEAKDIGIDDLLWLTRQLSLHGWEEQAFKVLTQYYSHNQSEGDQLGILLCEWYQMSLVATKQYRPLILAQQIPIETFSAAMGEQLEWFQTVKAQVDNKQYDVLEAMTDAEKTPARRFLLLQISMRKEKREEEQFKKQLEQAIQLAIELKNFYALLDLIVVYQLQVNSGEERLWNYSICLALEIGSLERYLEVVNSRFQQAIETTNLALMESMMKIFEIYYQDNELRSSILSSILSKMAYYYSITEDNRTLIVFLEENIHKISQDITSLMIYYLLAQVKDMTFKFPPQINRMFRKHGYLIPKSFSTQFMRIMFTYAQYAKKAEQDFFEQCFRTKLSKPELSTLIYRLDNMLATEKYGEILQIVRSYHADTLYTQGELYYYGARAALGKQDYYLSRSLYKKALILFNQAGLHHRCELIAVELHTIDESSGPLSEFDWKAHVNRLRNVNQLSDFILDLEQTIYSWIGFETVIPFLYDNHINNFTPLGNITPRYREGFEALAYSTRVLNLYNKNRNKTFFYDAMEMMESNSVHRLEIKVAYCIPMIVHDELVGTLYLHTQNLDRSLPKQQLADLEMFSSLCGIFLERLYRQSLRQTAIDPNLKNFHGIIGESRAIRDVTTQIQRIAPIPYSVFIYGESGVGKELIAKAIYAEGRYQGKLISLNCTNIPRDLFESELFGYKKGAFSGAEADRMGKIEAAEEGVIFMDEIGELSLDLQSKLLRVLQERTYFPVGSHEEKKTNARFIFATNLDLEKAVLNKTFRADLYARIKQFQITVPPLRDHLEDLSLLTKHFTEKFIETNPGIQIVPIPERTLQQWMQREWPLNVRELEYEVYRTLLQQDSTSAATTQFFRVNLADKLDTKQITSQYLLWLEKTLGSRDEVMRFLNISKATFYRLIKESQSVEK